MNKKYDDIKKEILLSIKDMLIEDEVAAKYSEAGEEGSPIRMVNALIDEMTNNGNPGMGEFFFMPAVEGAEEYAILQSVVTFEEEIEARTRANFDGVASVINFYLESGAFAGDVDGSNYVLKTSVMLPLDGDMETLKAIACLNASQAILTATAYCNLFIKVAEGDMTIDEVKALVKG